MLFTADVFCCDYSNSELKDIQCKQKTAPKSYKTEIKILTHPGLSRAANLRDKFPIFFPSKNKNNRKHNKIIVCVILYQWWET